MKNNYLKLLDGITKDENLSQTFKKHDRVLIIDGLNLFIRNFAMVNFINQYGNHIGGLGGFLRSLGSLINLIKPTEVYIIFDGKGSSDTRKNLHPEYKSGRNITRVTNWDVFKTHDEETQAKTNQIIRLIHYLKCLPIKIVSLDKVEADDIIAYLSKKLVEKHQSRITIVSADQDYAQLVSDKITLYRPVEKEFLTPSKILEKYGVLSENFILYKTLMGDKSDKINGIQGLGDKKLKKMFPDLKDSPKTLEDIISYCEERYKEHVIYSKVIFQKDELAKSYKLMDLKNPLLDDIEKEYLEAIIEEPTEKLNISAFLQFYKEDGLNNTIKEPGYWLKENFTLLNNIK